MAEQLTRVRGAFGDMPTRLRIAILGVLVVTILVMFLVVRAATGTEWIAVTGSLPDDQLGEAQATLEEAGIDVRVSPTGDSIQVAVVDKPKAASALMSAGIAAKGARAGCAAQSNESGSMMAKTSAEFDLMLETCREADVANMIEGVDGVESAAVDVTVAEDALFVTDEQPAKAAVVLETGGASLPDKSIKGIQATVASSFEGLKPSAVVVTDESGAVIGGDGSESEAAASMRKLEAEAKMNAKIERDLGEQIAKVVGPGNAVLTSNVELDMDAIERGVRNVEPAGENGEQLVESESTQKELLNGGASASVEGVTGTGSNIGNDAVTGVDGDNRTTTPDASVDGTAGDEYVKSDADTIYANNVVEEKIGVAQGSVMRFRLAAVVDDDVDPASADAVKEMIQAWMGGNTEDSLAFAQAPIAVATATKAAAGASAAKDYSGYVKWALLGIGLIGLAFVMRSSLRQRTAELLAPADDLLLLESGDFTPIPIAELEAALAAGEPSAERRSRIEMQKKVERIAESKPNDVANELRRWMHQDDPGYMPSRKAG